MKQTLSSALNSNRRIFSIQHTKRKPPRLLTEPSNGWLDHIGRFLRMQACNRFWRHVSREEDNAIKTTVSDILRLPCPRKETYFITSINSGGFMRKTLDTCDAALIRKVSEFHWEHMDYVLLPRKSWNGMVLLDYEKTRKHISALSTVQTRGQTENKLLFLLFIAPKSKNWLFSDARLYLD
jgi:hypothetical protein